MTCIKQKLLLCVSPIFCLYPHKCYLRRNLCWKLYNRRSTYKTGPTLFHCETVSCPLLYVAYIYIYFFLFFISFIPFMPQERKGPRGKEQSVAFRPFSLLHWWQARVLVVLYFRSKKSRFGYTSYSRDGTRRARRSRAQIYRPCKTGYVFFVCFICAGP